MPLSLLNPLSCLSLKKYILTYCIGLPLYLPLCAAHPQNYLNRLARNPYLARYLLLDTSFLIYNLYFMLVLQRYTVTTNFLIKYNLALFKNPPIYQQYLKSGQSTLFLCVKLFKT